MSFHCFEDDLLIYLTLQTNSSASIQGLLNSLNDVHTWMALNFLNPNQFQNRNYFILAI